MNPRLLQATKDCLYLQSPCQRPDHLEHPKPIQKVPLKPLHQNIMMILSTIILYFTYLRPNSSPIWWLSPRRAEPIDRINNSKKLGKSNNKSQIIYEKVPHGGTYNESTKNQALFIQS